MRVLVIGAGSAGLAALRQCSAAGLEVVCYDRASEIGGTWVYVPETGVDRYGLPIHSSMYKSLRTNLPKEVMGYPDYQIPENPKSYLTRTEILNFLNSYCDHFNLRKYIKFLHNVELVKPVESSSKKKWSVRVKDLEKNQVTEEIFDAVLVCNGHYFQPNYANIKGKDVFKGQQLHAHDYRVPDIFANKNVVVIGAGPSGMDLALEISGSAKNVILSHHLKDPIRTVFPANVVQKPDISEIRENEVEFTDGSKANVDVIFYCTGYKFSFPFLDESCGIKVDKNWVTPLWQHLVSIENPTLALVGLPFYVCAFSMFDLQVRFLLRFWKGEKQFPSKEEMLASEAAEFERRKKLGLQKKHFHMMGEMQGDYYKALADTAGISPLPPVLTMLHNESSMRFVDDLVHYREDRYKIVDDTHFVQLNRGM